MLRLIGAEGVNGPVREYKKALDRLYQGDVPSNTEEAAEHLARKAKAAVEALQPYLIRHGVADLKSELQWFGKEKPWDIDVPKATTQELELILRTLDRALAWKPRMVPGHRICHQRRAVPRGLAVPQGAARTP